MDEDNLSFARLIPVNKRAHSVFSNAVRQAQLDQNEAQLRFYTDEHLHLQARVVSGQQRSLDPEESFAVLSLDEKKSPRFPRLGWRVGRQSDIEIRIASIGEKSVAPAHFRLFLHPKSGILLLEANPEAEYAMAYRNKMHQIVEMEPLQRLVIVEQITPIILAGCEFQLVYSPSPQALQQLFKETSELLLTLHGNILHESALLYPNTENSFVLGRYVCGKKIGIGGFGDVFYGINFDNGDSAAIKDLRTRATGWQDVCEEISIQEDMKGSRYILQLVSSWCGRHCKHPKLCPEMHTEHIYLALEIALFSFNDKQFRDDTSISDALECFRQTLLGIRDLHRRGIMHRDITGGNMLILSNDPIRAVISDFGKSVRSLGHYETRIGPIHTLAPEVWQRNYSNVIDLWAWAYAGAEYLGYRPPREAPNEIISPVRLGKIIKTLDEASKPEMADFVDLLKKILVWNVTNRIGVDQALDHKVWKQASGHLDQETPEKATTSKRPRLDNSEDVVTGSTVPFST